MRFLADENLDFAVVRALAEETSRTIDSEVIAPAGREQRILLTEDKDFGWLAFVGGSPAGGVILVRFPGGARQALATAILELVATHGGDLVGSFTVLSPGQARITPGPGRPGSS